MKESDPSGMGSEQSLPQFLAFREITGDGKERGITGESSRFPEMRRRSCEFRENKMAGIHRTKSGDRQTTENPRGLQRVLLENSVELVSACMEGNYSGLRKEQATEASEGTILNTHRGPGE